MFYNRTPFYSAMDSDNNGGWVDVVTKANYEHYLLLYIDNELTPEQQRLVDAFMESYPDARETFEQMLESKLQPDDLSSTAFKQQLYQPDEQLLSYFDHELPEPKRIELETTLVKQPALQTVLIQLGKTRAVPNLKIVYPNKSSLYRSESKTPFLFFSPAVLKWAAIFIVLLGTSFWLLTDKTSQHRPIIVKSAPTFEQGPAPNPKQDQQLNNIPVQTTNLKSFHKEKADARNVIVKKNPPATPIEPTNLKQELPEIALATTAPQQTNEEMEATTEKELIHRNKNNSSTVSIENDQNNEVNAASIAIVESKNQPTETPTRMSKMKTMFKKARRIIERTTGFQSEESEFRFAVFSINTQNN